MAEHTQLPWERRGLMLIAPDGSKVVHFGGFRKEGSEAEANAALTDAAVNNHKALVEALTNLEAFVRLHDPVWAADEPVAEARAVLNKTTRKKEGVNNEHHN